MFTPGCAAFESSRNQRQSVRFLLARGVRTYRDIAAACEGSLPHTKPTILVVEDDPIIALDMKAMVEQCGCEVLGPAGNVRTALDLIEESQPDGAVLDINLGRERIWPVARALHKRGVPFVLASGYTRTEVEKPFTSAPLLSKPVLISDLKRGLQSIGILASAG